MGYFAELREFGHKRARSRKGGMTWMETQGIQAFDRLLTELPKNISKEVQKKAVNAMSIVVLRAYRRNLRTLVKRKTGRLAKAPGRKGIWYQQTNTFVSIVGIRVRGGRSMAPHAWLVEYGSKPRWTGKGRGALKAARRGIITRPAYRGAMPAFAPLRKAYDSSLARVKRIAMKELGKGVKKEALALARKYKTKRIA